MEIGTVSLGMYRQEVDTRKGHLSYEDQVAASKKIKVSRNKLLEAIHLFDSKVIGEYFQSGEWKDTQARKPGSKKFVENYFKLDLSNEKSVEKTCKYFLDLNRWSVLTELTDFYLNKLEDTLNENYDFSNKDINNEKAVILRLLRNEWYEARKDFTDKNVALVLKFTTKFTGFGSDISDLIGYGNIGLIDAVDTYDGDSGNKFSTHAFHRITHKARRGAENTGRTIKRTKYVHVTLQKIAKAEKSLRLEKGREDFSVLEVAQRVIKQGGFETKAKNDTKEKVLKKTIAKIRWAREMPQTVSFDTTPVYDQGGVNPRLIKHTIEDPDSGNAEKEVLEREQLSLLEKALQKLDPLERQIVNERFYEEKSFGEISVGKGTGPENMNYIFNRAIGKLRKEMTEAA